MRYRFYYLDDDHNVVGCNDMQESYEKSKKHKVVKQEHIGPYFLSTVFLWIDHSFSDEGPPVLFETMLFMDGNFSDLFCRRYCTWDEALAGHEEKAKEIRELVESIPTEEEGEYGVLI